MTRLLLAAAGAMLLMGGAAAIPASALGLGEAGELEHARANARAGGPISERDAELLQRYGCLSGTRNAFCHQLSEERAYPRRVHRKHRRHDDN